MELIVEKMKVMFDSLTEKSKRLDLLAAEKDEKRALMPPVEERKPPKSRNYLLRLVSAR